MCDQFFIPSPSPQWDFPIIVPIETTHLENVFVIECSNVEKSLCNFLSEEFLQNRSGSIHYVDIVSKFLTNCMDLLEDTKVVKQLGNAYVKPYFKHVKDYDSYIEAYVIEMSYALIGGLFSPKSLNLCPVTNCVYNSVKIAIKSKFKAIVDHALHAH